MTKLEILIGAYLQIARVAASAVFQMWNNSQRPEVLSLLCIDDQRAFYFANRGAILEQLEQANAWGAEWNIAKQRVSTRVDCAIYDALATLKDAEKPPRSKRKLGTFQNPRS